MGIQNQLKTALLLGLLTGVLLGIGAFFGKDGLTIAIIFAIIINFGTFFFSDKIVLKMYRAKEVNQNTSPRLYKLVKEVSHLASIPTPKIYIMPSQSPNAFATGRSPKKAAVACTEGILDILSDSELKGVIAHEIAHIKNRDTLIQVVAATIAGVISYLAMMARWGAIFGGMRDEDSGNIIQLLVLSIITPIIAMLIQLAISRSREFLADETGAKTIHNPLALASALEKLHNGSKTNKLRFGSEATSSLFIVNPFSSKGMLSLLSTHPPVQERIRKLRNMS